MVENMVPRLQPKHFRTLVFENQSCAEKSDLFQQGYTIRKDSAHLFLLALLKHLLQRNALAGILQLMRSITGHLELLRRHEMLNRVQPTVDRISARWNHARLGARVLMQLKVILLSLISDRTGTPADATRKAYSRELIDPAVGDLSALRCRARRATGG